MNTRRRISLLAICSTLLLAAAPVLAQEKEMRNAERDYVNAMLSQLSWDVPKRYYDPNLHGVNWEAKVREAQDKIKSEKSLNMAMAHVAALLDSLNDSHTFFIPPGRPYVLEHGWTIQMLGDNCFVTRVRPKGDADVHGVKPGDQLVAINGYRVNRANLWKMEYAFNVLRPQPELTVTLRDPEGTERKVLLKADFRQLAKVQSLDGNFIQNLGIEEEDWYHDQRIRTVEYGDDLLIAKLRSFMFLPDEAGKLISMARKHKALILDLRQNGGGAEEDLQSLVSSLFENEVKIGDRVGRNFSKPLIAKTNHSPFLGKLIVLVDSKSASAAEILARVVQLEKRGTLIGDRTSGSVMEARQYSYSAGTETITLYGASITEANLIMTDGQSLEHTGVIPDETLLPTAADLAADRDPVLSRAAALAAVKLSPEDAGKLFPFEWPARNGPL